MYARVRITHYTEKSKFKKLVSCRYRKRSLMFRAQAVCQSLRSKRQTSLSISAAYQLFIFRRISQHCLYGNTLRLFHYTNKCFFFQVKKIMHTMNHSNYVLLFSNLLSQPTCAGQVQRNAPLLWNRHSYRLITVLTTSICPAKRYTDTPKVFPSVPIAISRSPKHPHVLRLSITHWQHGKNVFDFLYKVSCRK